MPSVSDPASGWVRSANNRTAPEDYPYPLSGTWSSGHRAQRIRNMLEEQPRFGVADFVRMQRDVLSLRAVEAVPPLVRELIAETDERILRAGDVTKKYTFHRGSYVIDLAYEIANHGDKAIVPTAYFQFMRDARFPKLQIK